MRIYAGALIILLLLPGCESSVQPIKGDTENQTIDIEPQEIMPVGNLTFDGRPCSDVTGYVDDDSGIPYAVVGHWPQMGVTIVDVSDPAHPLAVAFVDGVPGFDIKYYKDHLYTVNGTSINFGKVINVEDPANPQIVGQFNNAHNIFISENGIMFSAYRTLRMYDLNVTPINPVKVWSDGVEGHDAAVVGGRLYDFHGGQSGTNIYDISDGENPRKLGTVTSPSIKYHHSGWPTADGNFLYICDELAPDSASDITIWNISSPGNPYQVGSYNDIEATVHNLYIIDDYAYVAYYSAGFQIFDVSEPETPRLTHFYDTSEMAGPGFDGAFGCYPFAPNNMIYVSDDLNGLFIFQFEEKQ